MSWARFYRQGRRGDIEAEIARAGQYQTPLNDLREAMALEKAVRRPRRWLLAILQQRIDVLGQRIAVLERINVVEQINCRGERGPFTPAQSRVFFEAAVEFHQVMPRGHQPAAPKVTPEEASLWLSEQPEDALVDLYSAGGHLLYFGPYVPPKPFAMEMAR